MILLLACAGPTLESNPLAPEDSTRTTPTLTELPESCDTQPAPPKVRELGSPPRAAASLVGQGAWTLEFDEAAEAVGFIDCGYARAFVGEEFVDQPWLCPDCDTLFRSTATMTEGYESCYLQIADADAARTELLAFGEVDGVPNFFRSGADNVTLKALSEAVPTRDGWTANWSSDGELTDGGTMVLTGSASFTLGTSSTEIQELDGALTEPSACGWPRHNPGGPIDVLSLQLGETVPNGRFTDQCGDPVDLWDFRGYYLIIDASSPDCGPCQVLAAAAEAARSRLLADCIPVEMVTLLNESLSAVNVPASLATQQAWAEEFGLFSPVLADRGWGYALLPTFLEADGFSLPSMVVVAPDGTVIGGSDGVPEEPFSELEALIRNHAP